MCYIHIHLNNKAYWKDVKYSKKHLWYKNDDSEKWMIRFYTDLCFSFLLIKDPDPGFGPFIGCPPPLAPEAAVVSISFIQAHSYI